MCRAERSRPVWVTFQIGKPVLSHCLRTSHITYFYCCDQMPDKKQPKGGRSLFGLQFEAIPSVIVPGGYGDRPWKQLVTLRL